MDILTHTLSGFAVGTAVASFSKNGFKEKLSIVLLSGLAGALPDIDAVSLWSMFDSTFGKFFQLQHSGSEIYYSKFWYSHHAFFHSIAASLLFAFLIVLTGYLIATRLKGLNITGLIDFIYSKKLALSGFIGGYLIHVIEDMPTPASVWEGVNLLWPAKGYIGGSGDIWWWNNYDIFLIVLSVVLINLTLHIANRFLKFNLKNLTIGVFVLGFMLSFLQIKTRNYDFAYSGNTNKYNEFEQKSKELQKEILGAKIYMAMETFDNKLSIYF